MMIGSEDEVVMDPRAEGDASSAAPAIALLPSSPDTDRLAELTSHGSDLSEASGALELALDAGEESALWMPLTMHAVTAYVRPFIHSNVRRRLDQMTGFNGVPDRWASVHAAVRTYRNTTVAHSQSDLASPLPIALLNEDGTARRVMGITASHPMPRVLAVQLRDLINEVATLVEAVTRPVVERLEQTLAGTDAATIAGWPTPRVRHHLDEDFTGVEPPHAAPTGGTLLARGIHRRLTDALRLGEGGLDSYWGAAVIRCRC